MFVVKATRIIYHYLNHTPKCTHRTFSAPRERVFVLISSAFRPSFGARIKEPSGNGQISLASSWVIGRYLATATSAMKRRYCIMYVLVYVSYINVCVFIRAGERAACHWLVSHRCDIINFRIKTFACRLQLNFRYRWAVELTLGPLSPIRRS